MILATWRTLTASDAIIEHMLLETRKVTETRQPSKGDCATLFFHHRASISQPPEQLK